MLIKDWLYAIAVCRKYKIRWNPFRNLSNASYYIQFDGEGKIIKSLIHMSPFYPRFKETFLHEVGHYTLHKRGTARKLYRVAENNIKYEVESIWYEGKLLLPLLVEESLASRFAKKAMKGEADVKYLIKALQTYSAIGYSEFLKTTPEDARTITRLTNFVEAGIRRIEK